MSISDDENYIALAGRKGFIIHSLVDAKWKLFKSQQEEAIFICRGGILFHQHYLVVAGQDLRYSKFEVGGIFCFCYLQLDFSLDSRL